jgi:hypothetical protein
MTTARANPRPLPGDFAVRNSAAAALRVDHAGEYGATRIYAGQRAVLKNHACAKELASTWPRRRMYIWQPLTSYCRAYGARPHRAAAAVACRRLADGGRQPRRSASCVRLWPARWRSRSVITEHYNEPARKAARSTRRLHPTIAHLPRRRDGASRSRHRP